MEELLGEILGAILAVIADFIFELIFELVAAAVLDLAARARPAVLEELNQTANRNRVVPALLFAVLGLSAGGIECDGFSTSAHAPLTPQPISRHQSAR